MKYLYYFKNYSNDNYYTQKAKCSNVNCYQTEKAQKCATYNIFFLFVTEFNIIIYVTKNKNSSDMEKQVDKSNRNNTFQ